MTGVSRSRRAAGARAGAAPGGAGLARRAGVPPPLTLVVCALVAGAVGCLYVDDINHPPVARLRVAAGADNPPPGEPLALPALCGEITFDASGSSDEDEPGGLLDFAWTIDGRDAVTTDNWRFKQSGRPGEATISFLTAGPHTVAVTAIDRRGAPSQPASVDVTVTNAPPQASVLAVSPASGCDDWVAGARITLEAKSVDIDPDATCDGNAAETLSYRWVLTAPEGSRTASVVAGPCVGDAPAQAAPEVPAQTQETHVCVTPDVPGAYALALTVDDGGGRPAGIEAKDGQTTTFLLAAAHDRPPCMDGFLPPPASYILDRAQPATFEVTEVLDDQDAWPPSGAGGARFTWSLWRESDPTWRALADDGASLVLDPTVFAVDELVRVRAQAADRVARDLSACDPAAALCDQATAYPTETNCWKDATCEAWVTWDARFR